MGVHGAVKSSYLALTESVSDNRLLDAKWLAEQEVDTWKHWVTLPVRRRLWLWRHGFTSPCDTLYDFETDGRAAYLSELQRNRLYKAINGRHRYLLDDKLSQFWMLADYPESRPAGFGFVDRGHVHGVAGTEYDGDPVPVAEWLPAAVRRESRIVLKQLRGKAGKEVFVAAYDEETGFTLDGESVTESELVSTVEELSGYLVSAFVRQHDYADDLYPHATNTIRVLTLWDDETGEVYMPIGVHRIGTDRSRPVDNWSIGGLSAEIDLETGEIGRAAQYPFSGDVSWYDAHPDTGTEITGTTIPNWEAVRETVDRLARDNTHLPMLGWDVILDESGEPIVIEANTGTSLDLLQVHRPLLADDRVARIVSRHLGDGSR